MKCERNRITQSHPNLCLSLSQYRLIEITGEDAEKYLQGQLTCDVAKLAVGGHTLTAHCDPKGKMSALFRLYRAQANRFCAVIHIDLLPEALTQLKKYAVFSKVTFTESDTPVYGVTSGEILAKLNKNSTVLLLTHGQKRALVWGESLTSNGDGMLWDLMDIQDGLPVLLKANQFELIPQAANLQAVENAISFTKGCYIGQETVARAKYRGANKRAMFTLAGQFGDAIEPPQAGETVEMRLGENWRATGTVMIGIAYQHTLWIQIILNKDIEPDTLFRTKNVALRICELPYLLENS